MTTDTSGVFVYPDGLTPETSVEPGCSGSCKYIMDSAYGEVVSVICETLRSMENPVIAEQVKGFCNALSEGLALMVPGIPVDPMHTDIETDEAYYEWIFDEFRFGFDFIADPSRSNWFIVEVIRDDTDPEYPCWTFQGDFREGYGLVVKYVLDYIEKHA